MLFKFYYFLDLRILIFLKLKVLNRIIYSYNFFTENKESD